MVIKIRKYVSIIFFAAILMCGELRSQSLLWAKNFGSPALDQGKEIAVDDSGNVYTIGSFQSTADFNHGVGVYNLTSAGSYDIYVSKTNTSGNFVWAIRLGAVGWDEGNSIDIDSSGNLVCVGTFSNTVDFDPGTGTTNLSSAGIDDIFVLKLNRNGGFIWAVKIGGSGDESVESVAINTTQDIFFCGAFSGVVDFNPGVGIFSLTSIGSQDIFISKLSSSGSFGFALSVGSPGSDCAYALCNDSLNNIYVTGFFVQTADFDPGPGVLNLTSAGSTDIFLCKFNSIGVLQFATSLQGPGSDMVHCLTLDRSSNIIIGGYTPGQLDFDNGPGVDTSSTIYGSALAFLAKYSSIGVYSWSASFGSEIANDGCRAVTTDEADNIFYTIGFGGRVDFDPGLDSFFLESPNHSDFGIGALDSASNHRWAKLIDGSYYAYAYDIEIDESSNIYVCGTVRGTTDFDPESGVFTITPVGNGDACLAKYNVCPNVISSSIFTSACDSFMVGNNVFSSSGIYSTQYISYQGCDSIVHLNLTILNSSTSNDVRVACDSLTWVDGNTYYSSNSTALYTFQNVQGCDSIVHLNLTINSPSTMTDVQTSCDSLVWIDGNTYTSTNNTATYVLVNSVGCDSIIQLNLTITGPTSGTDIQFACDSFVWIDGNTYTSNNNTSSYLLTNASGCDSLVTLDLTIQVIDVTVTSSANVLTANQSGATYQWLECSNGMQTLPDTSQTYTALTPGLYAVIVTVNGCSDTSACIPVIGMITMEHQSSTISIFPNPSSDFVAVTFSNYKQNGTVANILITDLEGRLISEMEYNVIDNRINVTLEGISAGTYLMHVSVDNFNQVQYLSIIK